MPEGEHSRKPMAVVVAVMSTILTIGAGILITGVIKASGKAETASKDLVVHDGSSEAHPVLRERMNGNYEKIQIQQQAIDEKIDRVLEAVEK